MSKTLYSYIKIPYVNMRSEPSHASEVISQALFSEEIQILEHKGGWARINTLVDRYAGWVPYESITQRELMYPVDNQSITIDRCAAHIYAQPDTIYGPIITLPFESRLELTSVISDPNARWISVKLPDDTLGYVQKGDVVLDTPQWHFNQIEDLWQRFQGLPYTWGGRSSFGYDCSGFVQMFYRRMGHFLPRDAKDQYRWEQFVDKDWDKLAMGDLIFFGFDAARIRHVGMHLNNGYFVHTAAALENAPYVRVSHLKDAAWNGSGYYSFRAARGVTS